MLDDLIDTPPLTSPVLKGGALARFSVTMALVDLVGWVDEGNPIDISNNYCGVGFQPAFETNFWRGLMHINN